MTGRPRHQSRMTFSNCRLSSLTSVFPLARPLFPTVPRRVFSLSVLSLVWSSPSPSRSCPVRVLPAPRRRLCHGNLLCRTRHPPLWWFPEGSAQLTGPTPSASSYRHLPPCPLSFGLLVDPSRAWALSSSHRCRVRAVVRASSASPPAGVRSRWPTPRGPAFLRPGCACPGR